MNPLVDIAQASERTANGMSITGMRTHRRLVLICPRGLGSKRSENTATSGFDLVQRGLGRNAQYVEGIICQATRRHGTLSGRL